MCVCVSRDCLGDGGWGGVGGRRGHEHQRIISSIIIMYKVGGGGEGGIHLPLRIGLTRKFVCSSS